VAILDIKEKTFFLLDATPDIRSQLDIVHHMLFSQKTKYTPDGVLLSHAHIGHYTGLIFFGYEALSTSNLTVFCSSRMQTFLSENGPWSQLVRLENIKIQPLIKDKEYSLTPKITMKAFQVPHRDEYSDTLGFIISGREKRLLYIPDIQNWTVWDRSIVDEAEKVHVALLDGTFFSPDELPGRDISKIGHPLIRDSMEILKPVVRKGRTRVYFTHLNHTNLALDPGGEARKRLKGEGFALAEDGQEFAL
jgi:pyrroloquinoline quinone biosynthesis protein B